VLDQLRGALGERRVRTSGCLGPCDQRDIIVVRGGRRPVWLARMDDAVALEALIAWCLRQGPTREPLPSVLASRRIPAAGPQRRAG
jgi:(2Fe-2S) ferredoxin